MSTQNGSHVEPEIEPTPEEIAASIGERIEALRERRAQIDSEMEMLRRAQRNVLRGREPDKHRPRRRQRTTPVRTSERQAGPGNVERVAAALRSAGGRATQAALTEQTGLNSGTMTYALRALEERGAVRRTGESVRRSPEFEEVKARRITMKPGSGAA
jgi:hypothetical protein